MRGHAIEVRVCAEDPANDFLPAIGTVVRWEPADLPGMRYDAGIVSGSEVTIHYDPLLAKVIGTGKDRDEATRRLRRALRRLRLDGVRSNLAFLDAVLGHPEFAAARLDTGFLTRHAELAQAGPDEGAERDHAIAAALWGQDQRRREAAVLASLPSGWRNNPAQHQFVGFTRGEREWKVAYRAIGEQRFSVSVDEAADLEVYVVHADAQGIALEIGDRRRRYAITEVGATYFVHSAAGHSELHEVPRFPAGGDEDVAGGCHATMPGRISSVHVEEGATVAKGDVLVVMEAMKMEHQITAPAAGRVSEVRVQPGDQVDAGAILVVIEANPES